MCIERLVRNLGFALAAFAVVAGVGYHLRISARRQRAGTLNTCPRRETAFMSAQTCLSAASASSSDARAVMRASNVAVRPMSSSTSTERPTSGVIDTTRAATTLRTDKPRGGSVATITSRASTWIWIR